MSLLDSFHGRKSQNSASITEGQLQIIVAHERSQHAQPDCLPQLQEDLPEVIHKYVPIDREQIQVELESQDSCSILELSVTLPGRQFVQGPYCDGHWPPQSFHRACPPDSLLPPGDEPARYATVPDSNRSPG